MSVCYIDCIECDVCFESVSISHFLGNVDLSKCMHSTRIAQPVPYRVQPLAFLQKGTVARVWCQVMDWRTLKSQRSDTWTRRRLQHVCKVLEKSLPMQHKPIYLCRPLTNQAIQMSRFVKDTKTRRLALHSRRYTERYPISRPNTTSFKCQCYRSKIFHTLLNYQCW